jgi:hypothetical protein
MPAVSIPTNVAPVPSAPVVNDQIPDPSNQLASANRDLEDLNKMLDNLGTGQSH